MKANFAAFTSVLCHLNATPLSVAVLAPCAWGKNLACGGAWQGVVNSAMHSAQQIQCGKCLRTKRCTATRQIRLGKRGKMGGACGRSGQSENGAVFGRRTSLSLSALFGTLKFLNALFLVFCDLSFAKKFQNQNLNKFSHL